jgi:hypothetical protein
MFKRFIHSMPREAHAAQWESPAMIRGGENDTIAAVKPETSHGTGLLIR